MIIDQVRQTIRKFHMINRGQQVLVAFSGGPDSSALLHILHTLREELHITLCAGHLNHQIRGREADEDERFARDLARKLDLPIAVQKVDVPALVRQRRQSVELVAREVRYQFLEEAARQTGASVIALGHNADDQVETVLLNAFRGAGTEGLAGIPPVRGLYVRPLIEVNRPEIELYCKEHQLHPRTDSTNRLPEHKRNLVRLAILPALEQYFPGVRSNLLRTAEIAREDVGLLHAQADEALRALAGHLEPGRVSLDLRCFRLLPPALQRRVAREAVRRVRGDLLGIEMVHVEAMRTLAATRLTGKRLELPGGVQVFVRYNELIFAQAEGAALPRTGSFVRTLQAPGLTSIPELGLDITATLVRWEPGRQVQVADPDIAYLDYESLPQPLTVRTRTLGDRFRPLGAPGTTKLQDFFVNEKAPWEQRSRVPIVVAGDQIAWVGGYRIAEPFKITPATRLALRLALIRMGEQQDSRS